MTLPSTTHMNVVHLMDALRQSIKAEGGRPATKKGKKRSGGQREMLLPISGKKGKEVAAKPTARPGTRQNCPTSCTMVIYWPNEFAVEVHDITACRCCDHHSPGGLL